MPRTKTWGTPYQAIDITGQRFGRLVALGRDGKLNTEVAWACQCDCGGTARVRSSHLRRGLTKSCGCLTLEALRSRARHGHASRMTHGPTKSRAYRIWTGMKVRCEKEKCPQYGDYGGRGIRVCDRWQVFDNFLADMGEPPKGMSLDRIDNDGGYEPSNVRWASHTMQARNRRTNKLTLTEAIEIGRAVDLGKERPTHVAARWGVSPSLVRNIVQGKAWPEVRAMLAAAKQE